MEARDDRQVGQAAPSLLQSYSDERQPVAEQVVNRAMKSVAGMQPIPQALGFCQGQSADEGWASLDHLFADSAEGREKRKKLAAAIQLQNYQFNCHGVELGNGIHQLRSYGTAQCFQNRAVTRTLLSAHHDAGCQSSACVGATRRQTDLDARSGRSRRVHLAYGDWRRAVADSGKHDQSGVRYPLAGTFNRTRRDGRRRLPADGRNCAKSRTTAACWSARIASSPIARTPLQPIPSPNCVACSARSSACAARGACFGKQSDSDQRLIGRPAMAVSASCIAAVGVHSIDHFAIQVPELPVAKTFFETFGLEVEETDNQLDLRASASDHVWGRILSGSRKQLAYLSVPSASRMISPRWLCRSKTLAASVLSRPTEHATLKGCGSTTRTAIGCRFARAKRLLRI